ncbi:hypothetical protein AQUCO_01000384v1 [Aquilegia coerulea]|uniref:F-box domain-containing protein n=1 Tax=Aquilegia coerulea TaxID=218851 RepID=A0A2G5EA82_AQUCA|nr:hypothetical protein AQUCO_01000384v1 [Aquilegia coerulea]
MASSVTPNQKKIAHGSLDRLSNLPKEVIDEILVRIPISDVAKTSMLSRSWRYKWMSMSKLVFNSDSFQSSNKRARTEADRINYVTNILLLHNGMVSKFEVKDFLESGCVDVDRWILVLSRKMVKELVLGFDKQLGCFFLRQYRVPACLFDCEDLNKLVLEGCELRLPSHYEGFRYLTHLDLHYVDVTKETIEGLVEKSPLLLYLKIWSSRYISIDGLNICAPNLIDCSIIGVFEGIGFHNVPKLEHVFLNILDVIDCTTCKLDEVLFGLGRIHSLNIFYPFMDIDILDREVKTAPTKLGITYCDLKVANLVINFNDSEQIYAVLCLCRSAPNLEELIIQVHFFFCLYVL